VYVRFCGDGMVVLVVYVDDFLVVATSLALMTVAKSELLSAYKCVDQGEVSWFLNMRVKRDAATGGISLDQSQYTLRVLERFGMLESNPVSTPADPGHVLTVAMCPDEEDVDHVEEMRGKPYRAAVGALMHLMVSTRPDIAAAVSSVARFASNPGRGHWAAVKRILRYLRGTVNYGVSFARAVGENGTVSLLAYSDSDWGGDRDTRRSTSGYLFLVGGGPVCWRSKLQATVATSTAEAEYVAVCAAIQQCMWVRAFFTELCVLPPGPSVIFEDNRACIAMAANPAHHGRTKHIGIKYHYVRECVASGDVQLKYVRTSDMWADIMTKPTRVYTFVLLRDCFMTMCV